MRVLSGRTSQLCVNVMVRGEKNSHVCQNRVNLHHFVLLSPPLSEAPYKDMLAVSFGPHLVLPFYAFHYANGQRTPHARCPFHFCKCVEKAYILMTGPLLLDNCEECVSGGINCCSKGDNTPCIVGFLGIGQLCGSNPSVETNLYKLG